MPQASHDLGLVSRLNVEAIGEPGKRTFRLVMKSPAGSAVLWLEKEQLLELSLSIKRTLGLAEVKTVQSQPPQASTASEGLAIEFKVVKQALEYDQVRGVFRFWNHDVEDDSEIATLIFEATSAQAATLSDEGLKVCAAGRPLCPLCHLPMDTEGHFCVRSNGHPTDAQERLE